MPPERHNGGRLHQTARPDLEPAQCIVDVLRGFLSWLAEERAVEAAEFRVGQPARKAAVSEARGLVPDDLLALYLAADGFSVEVRFRGDGGVPLNRHRLVLPTLRQNAAGYARRLGYEVVDDERVQVLDLAPLVEGLAHTAVLAGSDDVLVFDGDYVQPLGCNVAGFFNTAMSCLFTPGWLSFAAGVDDGRVRSEINRVRGRLGWGSLA
jgi:hypothetical protein